MLYDFSELFLLKGEDYVINDKLTIHHPTLDEISQCNEEKYWGFIQSLCAVPIDYQVQLTIWELIIPIYQKWTFSR